MAKEVNHQYWIIWHMEEWRCQVSDQPDCVAVFLSWSVEGQSVNNDAECLAGTLDQNLSVCGIRVSILVCEERWAANIRTDARAGGYGARMGTDHMEQTTDSLWKCSVSYPEGSWAHEGGKKSQLIGWTQSHAPTHRHCVLTSHLLGNRADLLCNRRSNKTEKTVTLLH